MADYFDKIRPVLEALQIGEAVIYPISRMKSVRTQASELGAVSIQPKRTEKPGPLQ